MDQGHHGQQVRYPRQPENPVVRVNRFNEMGSIFSRSHCSRLSNLIPLAYERLDLVIIERRDIAPNHFRRRYP